MRAMKDGSCIAEDDADARSLSLGDLSPKCSEEPFNVGPRHVGADRGVEDRLERAAVLTAEANSVKLRHRFSAWRDVS